jgi:nitric oxide dioxygenase
VRQLRQYSLSADPDAPADLRRITVKRVVGHDGSPDGEVSALLHATVHMGDELVLSAPFGDIVLDGTDAPLVLVSAGIGCTPLVGMLDHLVPTGCPRASRRPVLVLHADRSPADHALREETLRLVGELPDARAVFWYEHPEGDTGTDATVRTGLMDLTDIELPADAQVYLCGPIPFMRAVRAQLRDAGVPADRIRYEVFGPDLWLADATDAV